MYKQPRSIQVIVYVEEGGRREYLVLERRLGADTFWQPVSGSREADESDEETARRELREETGIAEVADLRDLGLVSRFAILPVMRSRYAPDVTHNVQVAYAARVVSREVVIDPREHRDYRWASYSEARALLRYESNRRALDLVEQGFDRRRRMFELTLPGGRLVLGSRTLVMGVLNTTPDSFSDGGRFFDTSMAVERALELEAEGADIIDIGGESSRPGAEPVPVDEEVRRVVPVVEAVAERLTVPISVDTTRAATARAALDAGARILNDISALRFDPELASVAAERGTPLVLMHMRGEPRTMQALPPSSDILADVERDLLEAVSVAVGRGVPFEQIVVDPGIGFGKSLEQNVELLARVDALARLDRPVLVGTSRKSFLGKLTGRDVGDRLHATVASVAAAVLRGAHVVRVHDVAACVDAVRVADAVLDAASRAER